ncbi:MAG: hypothetical protein DDT21_02091 [Syntrophomonadaceae bacterium]|nr:hypothetical protein [Bacillota bacterium]
MRQAVCGASLLLFWMVILILGLLACERGLQEVSGLSGYPGVLALTRLGEEPWVLTLTGRRIVLDPEPFLQLLRQIAAS